MMVTLLQDEHACLVFTLNPFELFVLRCRFAFYFGRAGTAFCEDEQGECDRLRRLTAGRNNNA